VEAPVLRVLGGASGEVVRRVQGKGAESRRCREPRFRQQSVEHFPQVVDVVGVDRRPVEALSVPLPSHRGQGNG